jgi:hypothetical protein
MKSGAEDVACHPIMMFSHGIWRGTNQALEQLLCLQSYAAIDHLAMVNARAITRKLEKVKQLLEMQPGLRSFVMTICLNEATLYKEMLA